MSQAAFSIIEIVGLLLTVLLVMIQLTARSVSSGQVDLSDDQRSVIPMLIVAMLLLLFAGTLAGLEASRSVSSLWLSISTILIVGALFAIAVSGIDASIAVSDAEKTDQQTLDEVDETETQEELE